MITVGVSGQKYYITPKQEPYFGVRDPKCPEIDHPTDYDNNLTKIISEWVLAEW